MVGKKILLYISMQKTEAQAMLNCQLVVVWIVILGTSVLCCLTLHVVCVLVFPGGGSYSRGWSTGEIYRPPSQRGLHGMYQ